MAPALLSGSLSSGVFWAAAPRAGVSASRTPPAVVTGSQRALRPPAPAAYLLTAAEGVLRPPAPAPAEAAAAPLEAGDPAQVCHPPGLHPEAVLLHGARFQGRGLHPDGQLQPPRSPASHDGCCSAWLGRGFGEHAGEGALKHTEEKRGRCPERARRVPGVEPSRFSVCPEPCPSVGVPGLFGSTSTSPGLRPVPTVTAQVSVKSQRESSTRTLHSTCPATPRSRAREGTGPSHGAHTTSCLRAPNVCPLLSFSKKEKTLLSTKWFRIEAQLSTHETSP